MGIDCILTNQDVSTGKIIGSTFIEGEWHSGHKHSRIKSDFFGGTCRQRFDSVAVLFGKMIHHTAICRTFDYFRHTLRHCQSFGSGISEMKVGNTFCNRLAKRCKIFVKCFCIDFKERLLKGHNRVCAFDNVTCIRHLITCQIDVELITVAFTDIKLSGNS